MKLSKQFRFWFSATAILQLLTGFIHALSFLQDRNPSNDQEKQLMDLLYGYKFDLGMGFHRSLGNIFLSLSVCLTLLCFSGGLTNLYLIRKQADPNLLKGIVHINLAIFGIFAIIMFIFTFFGPILMSGLILLALIITRINWKTNEKN